MTNIAWKVLQCFGKHSNNSGELSKNFRELILLETNTYLIFHELSKGFGGGFMNKGTETPGGGNTTVARCIMGRCIKKAMPYQQHEFDEKEYQTQRSWVEYVKPRKTPFTGKVYIAVGRWTGSMGEGIAMGFDGIKNAKVIGTEMAGLLGAVENISLPETKIGFQIPTERLYHVNGTPREKYKPKVSTKNIDETLKIMNQIN